MARLAAVEPAHASGKARELFDGPLRGMHLNIFKGLANSAAALQAYVGLSTALTEGHLSEAERELIALVVGQQNDCPYCLATHTYLGKKAGLSEEDTLGARRGVLSDPKLGPLAKFAKALVEKRGRVSDVELTALRNAGYTDAHLAEISANVALNVYTNFFNNMNETTVDLPAAPPLR